jgi:hypothetical protein
LSRRRSRIATGIVLCAALLMPRAAAAEITGLAAIEKALHDHPGADVKLTFTRCSLQGNSSAWAFLSPAHLVTLVDDWSVKYRAYANPANIRSLAPANATKSATPAKPAPGTWSDVFHANPTGLRLHLADGTDLGATTKTLTAKKNYAVVTTDKHPAARRITYAGICLAEEHWEK